MRSICTIMLALFIQTGFSQSFNLTLRIENIQEIKGTLHIGIFSNSDDFPKEGKEYKTLKLKVKKKFESILISNLPNGEYAIAIFHDVNSDGKCNTNILGIPKEPYGFSNNIKPRLFKPSFKDCKVILSSDKTIVIKLI
ncbi:MAG: DUF2141 domain-containing protein [Crocinitomix sp.]|nr:DUF2141 domain-containing protein [Crocinitomix sp.]